ESSAGTGHLGRGFRLPFECALVGSGGSVGGSGWHGGSRSRGQCDETLAQGPEVVELHATQQALDKKASPLLHAQEAGLSRRGEACQLLAPVGRVLPPTSQAPLCEAIE